MTHLGKYANRYSPLIILGAIQLVVILLAPSKPLTQTAGPTGDASQDGGFSSSPDGDTLSGDTTGPGASDGRDTGSIPGRPGSGGTTSVSNVIKCPGLQPAPFMYMPDCLKFSGPNGGASMRGVTDREVRFVWYENVINPALASVGSQTGLSYTKVQLCKALRAFTNTVNKRWQLYGRKLVSLDGPGSHSGYNQTNPEDGCQYPYYQADSCGTSDAACYRAQADVIASMKPPPAFVIGSTQVQLPFIDQLTKKRFLVLAQDFQDAFANSHAPYAWDYTMSLENITKFGADYFCKKLIGRPVRYAGSEVLSSGTNPTTPPKRKIGMVFPFTTPDSTRAAANGWVNAVKMCGADEVKTYPYASDPNTVTQDMSTIAARLKIDRVTTVYAFMDFLAPIFLTNALESQDWHPEIVIAGSFAIDNEILAQLYNPRVWRYAFGIALRGAYRYPPGPKYDYYKAYKDSGESGEPFPLSSAAWPYFRMAGTVLHQAGPSPTIASIQKGMFAMTRRKGAFDQPSYQWGVGTSKYYGLQDVAEVWYCPTEESKINGQPGKYMGIGDYRRFQYGQFDRTMRVFPNGPCGAG